MFTLTITNPDGTTAVIRSDYPSEPAAEAAGVAIQLERQPERVAFTVSPT